MADRNIVQLTLMSRSHPVCDLEYDHRFHCIRHILRFYDDGYYAPLGLSVHTEEDIDDRYSDWWGHRSIPKERIGIDDFLKRSGYSSSLEIAMSNHGLCLSDQYWMRGFDEDVSWEAINYFQNPFSDALGRALLHQGNINLDHDVLKDPSGASEGLLPKRWAVIDGTRTLIKGSRHRNQEPYNEVIATFLYERLLKPGEFIPYWLIQEDGKTYSACPNMLTDEEEFIPAIYVRDIFDFSDADTDLSHYTSCCAAMGIPDARERTDQMIICDYLMANSDRHYRNFGVVRNVETHECRTAPLFDTGLSLWCDEANLGNWATTWKSKPFHHIPEAQLRQVRDWSAFDASKLDAVQMFLAETLSAGPYPHDPTRVVFIEENFRRNVETVLEFSKGKR